MSAVQVTTYYRPYLGGIETHVAELVRALPEYDVDVEILCRSGLNGNGVSVRSAMVDGVQVRRLATVGVGEVARWPLSLALPPHADVIHFHGYSRPLLARTLGHLGRRPLVLTLHGSLQATPLDPSLVGRWGKRIIDRAAARRWLRLVSHIICLSPSEQSHLTEHFGVPSGKTSIWPNPCPSESLQASFHRSGASGRFLVLGRLARIKNVHEVLLALAADATLPGCDIAGPEGDDSARLRHLAGVLVPGRVRFLGPVEGSEKVKLIRGAKALVICSFHEAQPTVALEALAQETPIVASVGAAAGLSQKAALTYPGGDIYALGMRLRSLDNPLVLRERRAAAADLRALLCSPSNYAGRLAGLYRALANSPQGLPHER